MADQLQLASHPEWLNILHVRDGRSEIDAPAFFMAANGKTDPAAELHASLERLLSDVTDTDASFYCRYPSRSQWLIGQLPGLADQIVLPACPSLRKERALLDAHSVTLILASAHINSPASAFGHTFLRIDSSLKTPLTAYAINYAAQTAETSGIIYVYQGLFGGYEGRYSISTYAEKVKEYSDLENRDIWEYRLNLTDAEMTRLINHIFEIRHVYADYYFMSENCSYNLLWLLQVARPELALTTQFGILTVPIDTVRAVARAGLIEEEIYRPAARKRMVKLAGNLAHAQSRTFIQSRDFNVAMIDTLPVVEKISALELAAFELKRRRTPQEAEEGRYNRDLLHLLQVRSRLGEPLLIDIDTPVSPGDGHLSRRLSAGMQYRQGQMHQTHMKLGGKIAYHDLYDHEYGYLPGAYISFFDTQLLVDNQAVRLDALSVLDIRSYALQDTFFKPVSWTVQLGMQRLFDDRQHGFLKTGAGVTPGSPSLYGFAMVSPGVYVARQAFVGGALELGLIGTHKQFKYGVQFSRALFTQRRTQQIGSLFSTYQISQKLALNVQFEYKQLSRMSATKTLGLSLFYYF